MELAQIRLQSRPAKTQINQTLAQLSMEQPKARQSIEQPKADMKLETIPARLNIDQTQAWADMGMKGVARFADDNTAFARGEWLAGLARVARQGDQLMMIEHGGNPIASQAGQNAFDPPKEFNIGWIPKHGSVKIDYQPAKVNIDIKAREPVISATTKEPVIRYQPGSVTTSISQYNSLTIDFANLNYVGINFKISI